MKFKPKSFDFSVKLNANNAYDIYYRGAWIYGVGESCQKFNKKEQAYSIINNFVKNGFSGGYVVNNLKNNLNNLPKELLKELSEV